MSRKLHLLLVAILSLLPFFGSPFLGRLSSCHAQSLQQEQETKEQLFSWKSLQPPAKEGATRFTRLSSETTGISFSNEIETKHPLRRVYVTGYAGGGVAIGDLNGDQLPDLYLLSGPKKNKLYLQETEFKFTDHTEAAGVDGGDAWGTGAAFADVDNDGDLDIYVCNYDSPAQLYINDGAATFVERAADFGLNFSGACMMPAFADYDRDGYLDLFLLNNRLIHPTGKPKQGLAGMRNGVPYILPAYEKYYQVVKLTADAYVVTDTGRPDRLYQHNGSSTRPKYTDVTTQAGISDTGMGLSAVWWDYNRDGLPDLYVANDFAAPDHLWHNNGDGSFTDKLPDTIPHTSWFSMGADSADINNDGHWDLFVADMAGSTHFKEKLAMGSMNPIRFKQVAGPPPQIMRNALLIGTGTGRFLEAAYLTGIAATDWTWTVKFADFDNDGNQDLLVTNGSIRDFMNSDHTDPSIDYSGRTEWEVFEESEPRREKNLAFRGTGLAFEEVGEQWGLAHLGMSYAAAHADLDRDGDLDLVVANLDEPVGIYRNDSSEGNRLLIELHGKRSNRFAIGAEVRVQTAVSSQLRYVQPVRGFNSSNEALLHFGLGESLIVEEIEIRWPSGVVQTAKNLKAGRLYTITEPEESNTENTNSEIQPLYSKSDSLEAEHRETTFDDFATQPLLPNKHSQLGPGSAWGDIDNDGDQDFFLSGASGQPGQIHRRAADGSFSRHQVDVFTADQLAEDMGAVFFDADSDGDADLFVVSGGIEAGGTTQLLQDRLYVNDGLGSYHKADSKALPEITSSGGPVAAADFDRDGDLDLFVGGRIVPGEYPTTPKSLLLRNDSKPGSGPRFSDASDALAAGLKHSGMVTAALWTDVDQDGWIDLLLAREWNSIAYWRNHNGYLEDKTEQSGLAEYKGWWNGLSGRDLDNDGDIDFVATNFGLNTKYKATKEHPAALYYGSFNKQAAGTQQKRIIEAKFEGDTVYPVRGKGCSTAAMPHLENEYKTYRDFALAPLAELYEDNLSTAQRFTANYLKTSILRNNSDGTFSLTALPALAQISPAYGVVATEVTGDGYADIYLVQNFFHPQVETGRMDSGLSILLQGSRLATFEAIWPEQSGLVVPGDAKSLTTVDLDNDSRVDFVVGVNDSPVMIFTQNKITENRFVSVRLVGAKGNQTSVGALVTVERDDSLTQTAEVYAGSGYLSQSSADLFFGLGTTAKIKQIKVRWPDGSTQIVNKPSGKLLIIKKVKS